jgi:competence-damaged protein
MSLDLAPLSEDVLKAARRRKLTLLTAECCTAGLLSQLLSDAEEAADYFMAASSPIRSNTRPAPCRYRRRCCRRKGPTSSVITSSNAEFSD